MRKQFVLAFAAACMALAASAECRAGFARVDTTPPLGISMPGYFRLRLSDGILDPICAECVAVSDGENAALIYSVDNLQLINSFFTKAFPAITKATGVPRELERHGMPVRRVANRVLLQERDSLQAGLRVVAPLHGHHDLALAPEGAHENHAGESGAPCCLAHFISFSYGICIW